MGEIHKPRVAILASRSGTTAEAFIHATQDGRVDAEVGLVISNNPPGKAKIYSRIGELNKLYGLDIETAEISRKTHPTGNVGRGQTLSESAAICSWISHGGFAHVALMGYMKVVRGELIEEYGWWPHYDSIYEARMSNTHPGPLTETADTYGLGASERVLELGLAFSKHTVHLVAPGVDTGPKIAEHPVKVFPGDTAQELFDRLQMVEKAALPLALDKFLKEQRVFNASIGR